MVGSVQADVGRSALVETTAGKLRGIVVDGVSVFRGVRYADTTAGANRFMAPRPPADIVLGDGHGTTCSPAVMRVLEDLLGGQGFIVRRNDPYAGGYITRHYGRPREGVHAVQIEINRPLYMDEARLERLDRFAELQGRLTAVIAELARLDVA